MASKKGQYEFAGILVVIVVLAMAFLLLTEGEAAGDFRRIMGLPESADSFICKPSPEVCDGKDNNCNSLVDEDNPCPFRQVCEPLGAIPKCVMKSGLYF